MAGRPSNAIVQVEVHGLDQLERAWPAWERRSEHALGEMTMQVAEITRSVNALRVPVLTGRFRASSIVERGPATGTPSARVSEGGGLAYGRWLEYGKRRGGKAAKGRYLPPTARRQKRQLKKRLAETTQREIRTYPWPK